MLSPTQFSQYYNKPDLKALADSDDAYAQYVYGHKIINEEPRDDFEYSPRGVAYIERSAQNGCADAEYWMATYYLDTKENGERPTFKEQGLVRLEAATLSGSFEAAVLLGYLHANEGTMHNPIKATQLWRNAIRNEGDASAQKATSLLCSNLSDLFSNGAYGHPAKSDLAGQLHILSFKQLVSPQKQKDVLLVLSQIAVHEPELFDLIKEVGLNWPHQAEFAQLMGDDTQDRDARKKLTDRRIGICNGFRGIMMTESSISRLVTTYLKAKLPPEIQNIQNMKLGL